VSQILLFVVLGLGGGALTAAIALATVLSYRGSATINLATAAIALFGAYVFYGLRSASFFSVQLGTWPALLVTIALSSLLGIALDWLVLRPLRGATPLARLVATLGVLLVVQAAAFLKFGAEPVTVPQLLPTSTVDLFSVNVPVNQLILAAIVIVLAAALSALYRFTRFGLATRACSEDETKATLAGLSANEISMINTVGASVIAGILGVLAGPVLQLDPTEMIALIPAALAAALIANFTSFGIACATGLGIGILESLIFYAQTKSWYPTSGGLPTPGVPDVIIFLIVIGAMYWRGDSLPRRGTIVDSRLPDAPQARRLAAPTAMTVVVIAIALVAFPYDFRQALILTLIGATVALSFTVIAGFVGQISLLPLALAGISGVVVSKLSQHAGIGFPLGPLIGLLVAVALGLLVAVSALRVRGVSLAIVTLTAAVAVDNFVFANPSVGGGALGEPVGAPHLFGLDLGPHAAFPLGDGKIPSPVVGFLVLVVAVACCLLVANLRRSDLGKRMLAVRSNESAAAAAGVDVKRVKLVAFALSSLIAALAGVLYAYNFGAVNVSSFSSASVVALVGFVYMGGITTIGGAIVAGLVATEALVPHILQKWFGISPEYLTLIAGVLLIVNMVTLQGGGLADAMRLSWARLLTRSTEPQNRRSEQLDARLAERSL
jgi:branched-chain amino acid transport system permease protein